MNILEEVPGKDKSKTMPDAVVSDEVRALILERIFRDQGSRITLNDTLPNWDTRKNVISYIKEVLVSVSGI